jgi:uncharacterized protein (TIGR00369 family)
MFEGYPPDHHVLRDLGIEVVSASEGAATARLPVTPHFLASDGGAAVGVVATLVDVVGGFVAANTLYPDRPATADLAIHMIRPVSGPVIEARGAVLRKGRNVLVIEAIVLDQASDDAPVAWATMTFAVRHRFVESRAPVPPAQLLSSAAFTGGAPDGFAIDALSISRVDGIPGKLSMPVSDYVRNSFDAVQGGVTAILGAVAGADALSDGQREVGAVAVVDLQICFVATGRIGPMVASPRCSPSGPTATRVTIEVIDVGAGGRLAAVVGVVGEYP